MVVVGALVDTGEHSFLLCGVIFLRCRLRIPLSLTGPCAYCFAQLRLSLTRLTCLHFTFQGHNNEACLSRDRERARALHWCIRFRRMAFYTILPPISLSSNRNYRRLILNAMAALLYPFWGPTCASLPLFLAFWQTVSPQWLSVWQASLHCYCSGNLANVCFLFAGK